MFPATCSVISLLSILKFQNSMSIKILWCSFLSTQHWKATSILFYQERYKGVRKLSAYNSFDMFAHASFHHDTEAGDINGIPKNCSPLFHLCLRTYHLQVLSSVNKAIRETLLCRSRLSSII